jgi:hypothetical protein
MIKSAEGVGKYDMDLRRLKGLGKSEGLLTQALTQISVSSPSRGHRDDQVQIEGRKLHSFTAAANKGVLTTSYWQILRTRSWIPSSGQLL